MKYTKVGDMDAVVTVQQFEDEMTWVELFKSFVFALKGLGYNPEKLEDLLEELIMEELE